MKTERRVVAIQGGLVLVDGEKYGISFDDFDRVPKPGDILDEDNNIIHRSEQNLDCPTGVCPVR